jgi:putative ABC transport system substrate-binding protein
MLGACQPGVSAVPAAQARTVLYVSTLGATEDAGNLQALRAELAKSVRTIGAVTVIGQSLAAIGPDDGALTGALRHELARHAPDLIVTSTMQLARLAGRVEKKRPIVFEGSSDPLRYCLVDALSRPGRNATGYTSFLPFEGKMIEGLRDAFSGLRELVVLVDGGQSPLPPCGELAAEESRPCAVGFGDNAAALDIVQLKQEARRNGLRLRLLQLCTAEDLDRLPALLASAQNAAVLVPLQLLFYKEPKRLAQALRKTPWPAMYARHFFVREGGLMSLSPAAQVPGQYLAYELVVRILAGESPANLPVQKPDGFELRINTDTARAQGLRPSQLALYRAQRLLP